MRVPRRPPPSPHVEPNPVPEVGDLPTVQAAGSATAKKGCIWTKV
ncbi:hypothetical protein ACFPM0_05910 [Pseudonocardia sulfidoxydans]